MKTTKFLAVLAVLAMAFAAFTIIAPTSESDANASAITTATVGTTANLTAYDANTGITADATAYYFDEAATVSVPEDYRVVFFVKNGVTLTLNSSTDGTTYGYAFVALVNVTSESSDVLTFQSVTLDVSAWQNDATNNAITTLAGGKTWGHHNVSFEKGDTFTVTAVSGTTTNFTFGSTSDETDLDVWGDMTVSGTFGDITFKADATLTCKSVTGDVTIGSNKFTLTGFSGSITAGSTQTVATLATWTAGDITVTAGELTNTAAISSSTGSLTINSGATFDSDANLITSGDVTVLGTLEVAANLTVDAFTNKGTVSGETVYGTLTVDGAGTLTFNDNSYYYVNSAKSNELSWAVNEVISIASKKTFTIENKLATGSAADARAAGITTTGTLVVSGAGTLKIDVEYSSSVSPTSLFLNAIGIWAKNALTIESNAVISAVGTSTADSYVYGCGIYVDGSNYAVTVGPSTAASTTPVVTITGNDRGIYDHDDASTFAFQNVKATVTGGEKGIKGEGYALTVSDADLDVLVSTGKANKAGVDNIAAIQVKSFAISGASNVSAESIIVTDASTVAGTSTLTVLADSKALLPLVSKQTGESVWTEAAGVSYGLMAGTYAKKTSSAAASFTTAQITLSGSAVLVSEPGTAVLAKIGVSANDYIDFGYTTYTAIGSAAGYTDYELVPMVVGGSENMKFGIGSIVMDGCAIYGEEGVDYVISGDAGTITVKGTIEMFGVVSIDIMMEDKATILVPAGETLKLDNITIAGDKTNVITILGEVSGTAVVDSTDGDLKVASENKSVAENVFSGDVDVEDNAAMAILKLSGNGANDKAYLEYLMTKYAYVGLMKQGTNDSLTIPSDLEIPKGITLYLGAAFNNSTAIVTPAGYTGTAVSGSVSDLKADAAVSIIVGTTYEMDVTEAEIIDYSSTRTSTLDIDGSLVLDDANVCAIVAVDIVTGYVSIKNAREFDGSKNPTSNQMVGYGNTMNLSDATIKNKVGVYVYGILNIKGATTFAYGTNLISYYGSTVNIDGTMLVEGNVDTAGTTNITGSVNIFRSAGSATWTNEITGWMTVSSTGTLNITSARQDGATDNILTNYGFLYLYGTSTITGTLAGDLVDYGTLTFNGTSAYATVYLRNGVSASFVAVYGTLYVDDSYAATDDTYDSTTTDGYKKYVMVYDGNTITLHNIAGVVITETVKETAGTVKVDDKDTPVKYYASTLTIAMAEGKAATASADKTDVHGIIVSGGNIAHKAYGKAWSTTVSKGFAEVSDITVGKNGSLSFVDDLIATNDYDNIKVTGTVTVLAENAYVYFINDDLEVTVEGMIHVNDDEGFALLPTLFAGAVNATYCYQDDAYGNTDYYLVPLTTALENIADVDDNTVYVYGTQSVSTTVSIPGDATVYVQSDSTLKIAKKGVVTIEVDGTLDASAGTINVIGVLVVSDKDTGLRPSASADKFIYQVKTTNGNVETYSGIEGALSRAVSGDVIEMSQSGTISSSATVPEGVKLIVPSKITLTVGSSTSEVTFTVDGQLQILRNGAIEIYGVTYEAEVPTKISSKLVTIIDNGSILVDNAGSFFAAVEYLAEEKKVIKAEDYLSMTDFVAFEMKVDGRVTYVYSNLGYAAENVTYGYVIVDGSVSGGDIEFTPAKDKQIVIIIGESDSETSLNAMAVTSLTLNNKTTLVIEDTTNSEKYNPGVFNGTIYSLTADGAGAIKLIDATGIIIQAYMEELATGEVYHTYLYGPSFDGTISVDAGVIEIDGFSFEFTINDVPYVVTITTPELGNKKASTAGLYVDSDAGLVVSTGATMTVNDDNSPYYDDAMAVIDGTLLVNGTLTIKGYTVINGALLVQKDKTSGLATVSINDTMDLNGTMVVSEDSSLKGTVTVSGEKASINLGVADATGDAASIVGPVTIASKAFINAYAGSDITGAKLNWDVATESSKAIYTDVYVFGLPFVTTYTHAGAEISLIGKAITADTEIIGCDVAGSYDAKDPAQTPTYYLYWFTDLAAEQNLKIAKSNVGVFDTVYFNPAAAKVQGKVTVGVGLTLYVDGKIYDDITYHDVDYLTVGTHTVSVQISSLYDGDKVTIKFNDKIVPVTAAGGTITVTPDMKEFTLVADGAAPYVPPEPEPTPTPEAQSEWTITTILLCVLVVLIAIMAVIVALRLNRN